MNVYIYAADIFCEACGKNISDTLAKPNHDPVDPAGESGYDSDDFPKGPYPDGGGEADSPQHCGSGSDCVNAIKLSGNYGNYKIGAFLENPLTVNGLKYVAELIYEGQEGVIIDLWSEFYRMRR